MATPSSVNFLKVSFANYVVLSALFILQQLCLPAASDDILSCGGFVKGEIDINYSKVEIKLYTTQGTLKYHTDCAPNNGYYLIPLYDRGDYVIKISPPDGWRFEPSEVRVSVDGATDLCSQNKDINFKFLGFSITGKVVSKGQNDGPSGVKVVLRSVGSDVILQETTTKHGGIYNFGKILPGEYMVTASHSTWSLTVSTTRVVVDRDNGIPDTDLVVSGYEVKGYVTSDSVPIKGVRFLLYSESPGNTQGVVCSREAVKGLPVQGPACHIASDEKGVFRFQNVSPGKYRVIPFYKGEHTSFEVKPSEVEFTLGHESQEILDTFEVQGFSVSGYVRMKPGGTGIPNAEVLVGDSDGYYRVDNIRAGVSTIHIKAAELMFIPITLKITPNSPQLPDIIASRFWVCGLVHLPSGVEVTRRRVQISGSELPEPLTLTTDENGKFCTFLKTGTYESEVVVSEMEEQMGITFSPKVNVFHVSHSPMSGIIFSLFRAEVSGTVTCMSSCADLQVTLRPVQGNYNEQLNASVTSDKFIFHNVLPGEYEILVLRDEWCWQTKILKVTVSNSDVKDLAFLQTGFSVTVSSTHETLMKYTLESGLLGNLAMQRGTTKFCVPDSGKYTFVPVGCHNFTKKEHAWSTDTPELIVLSANSHLFSGIVISPVNSTDLKVKFQVNERIILVDPLPPKVKEDRYEYVFQYILKMNDSIDLEPVSEQFLFDPPKQHLVMENDCMLNAFHFVAKKGLFIEGAVSPPLADVTITVVSENLPDSIVVMTDLDGKYSIGPLHSEIKYKITAEKAGYILSAMERDGDFEAYKLAEVIVKVMDTSGLPLMGVLVSLSGGSGYRQNSQTSNDGLMIFRELGPGDYFMKPMLKEYTFTPGSEMVHVDEGATVEINVIGKRVAYSCYGRTTSLTGEVENSVMIEAVGMGDCSHNHEEGISDENGKFRIRGLQPKCEYKIQLKREAVMNQHIERSTPTFVTLKVEDRDILDVHLVMFRYFKQTDVSAVVKTSVQFLPSLKARLYREDIPESPFHTFKLEHVDFFLLPPLPMDNKYYTLVLDSTLSKNSYDYDVPEITFRANTSYLHLIITFNPVVKSVDHDLGSGSLLLLPVLIALGMAAYNYKKVLTVVMHYRDVFQTAVKVERNNGSDALIVEPVTRRKTKPRKA